MLSDDDLTKYAHDNLDRYRSMTAEEIYLDLAFHVHYKNDQEFLRQCGIAWPPRS
jgi:hypothetical protein